MRIYRLLARLRADAISTGEFLLTDPRVDAFSRNLAKLGEHTWGNNEGTLFYVNYSNSYFDANIATPAFQQPLLSFRDQRRYIAAALAALADHPLRAALQSAVDASAPSLPSWSGFRPVSPSVRPIQCEPGVEVWVDTTGTFWANVDGSTTEIASLFYVTHSEDDFVAFIRNYSLMYLRDEHTNIGFDNWGLAACGAVHSETQARPSAVGAKPGHCDVLVNLTLPKNLQSEYGAPSFITLHATVGPRTPSGVSIDLDLQWAGKRPTRMAESIWLTVGPRTTTGRWQLHKLGSWIDATDVVLNGSRNTHAVDDEGVRLVDQHGDLLVGVRTVDAAVVATTERNPVVFSTDPDYVNTSSGMHFSLFNNGNLLKSSVDFE